MKTILLRYMAIALRLKSKTICNKMYFSISNCIYIIYVYVNIKWQRIFKGCIIKEVKTGLEATVDLIIKSCDWDLIIAAQCWDLFFYRTML